MNRASTCLYLRRLLLPLLLVAVPAHGQTPTPRSHDAPTAAAAPGSSLGGGGIALQVGAGALLGSAGMLAGALFGWSGGAIVTNDGWSVGAAMGAVAGGALGAVTAGAAGVNLIGRLMGERGNYRGALVGAAVGGLGGALIGGLGSEAGSSLGWVDYSDSIAAALFGAGLGVLSGSVVGWHILRFGDAPERASWWLIPDVGSDGAAIRLGIAL